MANTIFFSKSATTTTEAAALAAKEIKAIQMDSLMYSREYMGKTGETKTRRASHLVVAGARIVEGALQCTLKLNLTAIGQAPAGEGNRWAKGHFALTPDFPGYQEIWTYAEATAGRNFKGGELVFAAGEKINYYLIPDVGPDGWFLVDLQEEAPVVINGVSHTPYKLVDPSWDGMAFAPPFHKLEVQRPTKRPRPF